MNRIAAIDAVVSAVVIGAVVSAVVVIGVVGSAVVIDAVVSAAVIKVSKILNAFAKSSFQQKYQKNISKISALKII